MKGYKDVYTVFFYIKYNKYLILYKKTATKQVKIMNE